MEEIGRAATNGSIQLGLDHTALVQELVPYTDGHITRVETLGGKFLYGINVYPAEDSFNLCPAGKHYFYDINALSHFVADARNVVGFDPFARLVDYIVERAGVAPVLEPAEVGA